MNPVTNSTTIGIEAYIGDIPPINPATMDTITICTSNFKEGGEHVIVFGCIV